METIREIIPQFGELNKICRPVVSGERFDFEQQRFVSEFYHRIEDVPSFEQAVIGLTLEVEVERAGLLLKSLSKEVAEYIAAYSANQSLFGGLDIDAVCRRYHNRFDWNIQKQSAITNECSLALREVSNSIESAQGEPDAALLLEYDHRKREYDEQHRVLNELYAMKEQAKTEILPCLVNRFGDIRSLGERILAIIDKYVSVSGSASDYNDSTSTYFNMKLISAVYELCNGVQFEQMSEKDFYAALNLQSSATPLKILPREKGRVCYLVYLLSEQLPKPQREDWRNTMLDRLDISLPFYSSKYKEPVSDFPSEANQEFAQNLTAIFP